MALQRWSGLGLKYISRMISVTCSHRIPPTSAPLSIDVAISRLIFQFSFATCVLQKQISYKVRWIHPYSMAGPSTSKETQAFENKERR